MSVQTCVTPTRFRYKSQECNSLGAWSLLWRADCTGSVRDAGARDTQAAAPWAWLESERLLGAAAVCVAVDFSVSLSRSSIVRRKPNHRLQINSTFATKKWQDWHTRRHRTTS